MTTTLESRQALSSDNQQERELRETDTRQLVHDIIGKHEAYFAKPGNRLDFLQSLDADGFLRIAQYANAKLRSEKPHEIRQRNEQGSFMPMMHTPSFEDKPAAFKNGYKAIEEYLDESDDPVDKKIEGVAMATEALVLWVHPFNDGNGRTSRFLGKLIEEGAVDIDSLVKETASDTERGRIYSDQHPTRESVLEYIEDNEAGLGDALKEKMRQRAENTMSDVDAMYHNIKLLLENDTAQLNTLRRKKVA